MAQSVSAFIIFETTAFPTVFLPALFLLLQEWGPWDPLDMEFPCYCQFYKERGTFGRIQCS